VALLNAAHRPILTRYSCQKPRMAASVMRSSLLSIV
jgi:hypothetical protein